jgi:hypothetical protein
MIPAVIAALASIAVAFIMTSPDRKRNREMHQMLTVNHHSSDEPTILDRLDTLETLFREHMRFHREHEK